MIEVGDLLFFPLLSPRFTSLFESENCRDMEKNTHRNKNRKRENIFHLLVHSPDGCYNWGQSQKPELHLGGRGPSRAILLCFLGHFNREIATKTQTGIHMECKSQRQRLNLLGIMSHKCDLSLTYSVQSNTGVWNW